MKLGGYNKYKIIIKTMDIKEMVRDFNTGLYFLLNTLPWNIILESYSKLF